MESVKILVGGVVDILKYTLGADNFSSTLLLSPFVLWIMIQIISYFKLILRSSYKKW